MPLSRNQFFKYSKMGFNIDFIEREGMSYSLRSEYGGELWARWRQTGCISENCSRPLPAELLRQLQLHEMRQPFFIEIYHHIVRLWKTGGIYNDFSYLFLGHLEDADVLHREGSRLRTVCGLRAPAHLMDPLCLANATQIYPPTVAANHPRASDEGGLRSWSQAHFTAAASSRTKLSGRGDRHSNHCTTSTLLVFREVILSPLSCLYSP